MAPCFAVELKQTLRLFHSRCTEVHRRQQPCRHPDQFAIGLVQLDAFYGVLGLCIFVAHLDVPFAFVIELSTSLDRLAAAGRAEKVGTALLTAVAAWVGAPPWPTTQGVEPCVLKLAAVTLKA